MLKSHPSFERLQFSDEPVLSLPGLEIYPDRRKIFRNRREIDLTAKEYDLLCLLAENRGRVLTYEQIYERIWHEDGLGNESNAVGCHVRNLRELLLVRSRSKAGWRRNTLKISSKAVSSCSSNGKDHGASGHSRGRPPRHHCTDGAVKSNMTLRKRSFPSDQNMF